MNKRIALTLSCGFALVLSVAAEEARTQRAEELVTRAYQVHNLEAAAKAPYRVDYRFKFTGSSSGMVEGTYSWLWVSTERWRREISVQGFSELTVANGNKQWVSRSLSYVPEPIVELKTALEPTLKVEPEEKAVKIWEQKHDGVRLQCADFERKGAAPRTLCFDESSGALTKATAQGTSSEYSDFEKSGPALVPRNIRVFNDNRLEVDAQFVALTVPATQEESEFAKPPGAEEWANCESPVPEKAIKKQAPEYPGVSRMTGRQGTVRMYGVIETDGTVKNLTVTQSASKPLDDAAVEAVKNWRYQPSTCNGTPIRAETQISINFKLSQ
jgi:TonB family protein